MTKQQFVDAVAISYMAGKSFPVYSNQPDGNLSIRWECEAALNLAEALWEERQKRLGIIENPTANEEWEARRKAYSR